MSEKAKTEVPPKEKTDPILNRSGRIIAQLEDSNTHQARAIWGIVKDYMNKRLLREAKELSDSSSELAQAAERL